MASQNVDGWREDDGNLPDGERSQGAERASADETPTMPHGARPTTGHSPTAPYQPEHRAEGGAPHGAQPAAPYAAAATPGPRGGKRIGVSVVAAVLSLVGAFVLGGAGGATVAAGLTAHSSHREFGDRNGFGQRGQQGGVPGGNGNGFQGGNSQNGTGSQNDGGMPGGSSTQNGGSNGQGGAPGTGQNAPGQGTSNGNGGSNS